MAKKRFTDDLSGLFESPLNKEATQREAAAMPEEEQVEVDVPASSLKARKKLSSKGFTADLDAFLSEGFDREPLSSSPFPAETGKSLSGQRGQDQPAPRPKRRKTGLDLLIRSTVSDEDRGEANDSQAADTKRVTLIFKKDHLEELKEEAKKRGVFLKDVVQEMVNLYLEK